MDFLVEVLILMVSTYLLLHSYAHKDIKTHVIVLTYLSWLLSFGIVVILPCDIYYSQQRAHLQHLHSLSPQPTLAHQLLYLDNVLNTVSWFWFGQYWITFLLSWVVLPLIQEYEDSGEITFRLKLRRALINNLVFYLGALVITLLFFVVWNLKHSYPLDLYSLLAFLSSASNCFGNLLIALLMSKGLITIPRTLYQSRNMQSRLKYIQLRIAQLTKQQQEQYHQLLLDIQNLYFLEKSCQGQVKRTVEKVMRLVPQQFIKAALENIQVSSVREQLDQTKDIPPDQEQKAYDLNRAIKKQVQGHNRLQIEQEIYISEGSQLVGVLTRQQQNSMFNYLSPIYIYQVRGANFIKWVCSLLLALLGLVIVVAEFVISFQRYHQGKANNQINRLFSYLLATQHFNLIQVISFSILSYLCIAVNQGLFKLKLANLYGLYKNQQTDAPSLLFASINFSRVSVPLCFNFLRLSQIQNSQFQGMMGQLDQGFFSDDSSLLFSSLLVLLCLCNLFEVWTIILRPLGLEYYDFNNIFSPDTRYSSLAQQDDLP